MSKKMEKDTIIRFLFLVSSLIIVGTALWMKKDFEYRTTSENALEATIAVATDLHYLAPELTDHGVFFQSFIENGDGKVIQYSEEVTEAFVNQIMKEKPEVLVLSGDITFNGEKQSHIRLAEKLKNIEDAGILVLVMPGNHDLYSSNAASFEGDGYTLVEGVDALTFEEIYGAFGFGEAIARDENSLSYVAEVKPELWILMLDVNTGDSKGTIKSGTFDWVKQQLEKAGEERVRVVAVSHQNVMQHNDLFSYGYTMGNAEFVQELYEENKVICNLTGHIHMQHISQSEAGLVEIATSSLMVSPNQYGVLKLKDKVANYHTVVVDVATWANENGVDDLQEFAQLSGKFMWDTAYNQAAAALEEGPNTSLLSTLYADINTAYFAGRMDEITWDEEGFHIWEQEGGFIATYLKSIAEDGFKNHTQFEFDYK